MCPETRSAITILPDVPRVERTTRPGEHALSCDDSQCAGECAGPTDPAAIPLSRRATARHGLASPEHASALTAPPAPSLATVSAQLERVLASNAAIVDALGRLADAIERRDRETRIGR